MARTKNMPEVHQPVLNLIAKVFQAHQAGSGSFALFDLAKTFPITLSPEEEAQLKQRGDLKLQKTSPAGGTFENDGPAIKLHQSGAKVTVPKVVSGTYQADAQHFTLKFDPAHTIEGKLFLFSIKLQSIAADQQKVFIDASGDVADTTIIHG